jgi:hypothetical protein
MWIMPDRRTIWLKNQDARKPVIFYAGRDGKRLELVITKVGRDSVTGCLLLPGEKYKEKTAAHRYADAAGSVVHALD